MSTLFLGGPPIGCDSMTITYPFIEAVEAQAGRSIEMETRLSDTSLANCHAQQQSRLFTLPPELRNVIFELATQPDSATPECDYIGNSTDSYHLPGDVWSISPSTVLPQICRRAWLESNFLPLKYAEHIFEIRGSEMLGSVESQCLSLSGQDELKRLICFMESLRPDRKRSLAHIQIFASSHWIYQKLLEHAPLLLSNPAAGVEVLTISIRRNDWTYFAQQPGVPWQSKWLERLLQWPALPSLREIRVELEADWDRKHGRLPHLDRIVSDIRQEHAIVERKDCLGGTVRLELLDEAQGPPLREWRNDIIPGTYGFKHIQLHTLVWRIKQVIVASVPTAMTAPLERSDDTTITIDGKDTLLKFVPRAESTECIASPWKRPSPRTDSA